MVTFETWLIAGVELGFCSQPCCALHGGVPRTEEEEASCIFAVRLTPEHAR